MKTALGVPAAAHAKPHALAGIASLLPLLAACGGGGGQNAPSSIPAPSSLVVIASSGENAVSWAPVAGASGYRIYWSTTTPVGRSANKIDGATSPYRHEGLANGTRCHYAVAALDGPIEGELSPEAHATPDASAADYDPPWASAAPLRTLALDRDSGKTSAQNGDALKAAMLALQPGDRLEVGTGVWSIASRLSLDLQGTSSAPIWVVAKHGQRPVLTRPDAAQNAVNLGSGSTTRYLCLRGLEITGGDTGLKLYACHDLWLDRCHIHDTAGAGVAANSDDTDHLYVTRNEIQHTSGTGEGLYLGANNGAHAMSASIVALNHVHDTGGEQGDGIEIKQGSYANWIVENVVHDTHYPCILLSGTGGMPFNLVERNVCWRSDDNVLQVQGEAVVRNNLLMHGAFAFHSHDHQGAVANLTFVENTLINAGPCAELASWEGRPGMVFANNVVYSQSGPALTFADGSAGVTLAGNVVLGAVTGAASGWVLGTGLRDFTSVTWDAARRDASPSAASSILGSGAPAWQSAEDITGATRSGTVEAGCYDG